VVALALLWGGAGPALADNVSPTYARTHVIPNTGLPLRSFDISFVERSSQTYFLADRSNKSVDIFDAQTDTFITRVDGFVGAAPGGNEVSGPNGVLVVHDQNEAWAGDGDSSVKVIVLATNTVVKTISTGGTRRADEMSYDQKDKLVLVANDADDPPFVSLIDTRSRMVVGKIEFPHATNGLEQSVWDPAQQLFFQAVPELDGDPDRGEVAVIDPLLAKVVKDYPVKDCQPAGLTLGPKQHLLLGCSGDDGELVAHGPQVQVMDARSGDIVAVIRQVGGADEVWYNPGDHRFYLAERAATIDGEPGGMGVIDADTSTAVEAVHTGAGAHSLAADAKTNHIFVPVFVPDSECPAGCLAVFQSGGTPHSVDDLPPGQ
jgi:DNA-binding beta-propeller fold protein YncE